MNATAPDNLTSTGNETVTTTPLNQAREYEVDCSACLKTAIDDGHDRHSDFVRKLQWHVANANALLVVELEREVSRLEAIISPPPLDLLPDRPFTGEHE